MVVSNVLNVFEPLADFGDQTGGTGIFSIVGSNIDSSKTITDVIIPELNIGSGEILYIQNMRPITRSFEQQEEFKIVLGF